MTLPFPEGKLTQRVLPWLAAVLSVSKRWVLYVARLTYLAGGQNELLRASYIDTTTPILP